MRFRDIPQFTRTANYHVNVGWHHFEESLRYYVEQGLNLDPDFQRAHVWDDEKRRNYVEYILKGGMSGKAVYMNCPDWNGSGRDDFVLVDGKQRVDAVLRFVRNELPIFDGHFYRDFTDSMDIVLASFNWYINDLDTRSEVLQWYLDLNSGGVMHTEEELGRVRALLEVEKANPNPKDVARAEAKMKWRAEREKERETARGKPDVYSPPLARPRGRRRG